MTGMDPRKGKYVTRSVYQKVCEENKRLIADIREMVSDANPYSRLVVVVKWRRKFYMADAQEKLITTFAKSYLKEHPECDIRSPKFKKPITRKS